MKYDFIDKIIHDIKLYFISNDVKKIILSISGGIDSIFLFNLLLDLKKRYPLEIILYHVNYNMNSNSILAVNLLKKLSNKHNIVFLYDNIKIKNKNFESEARIFRYSKLKEISIQHSVDSILTAHHYNDQLETLLMKEDEGADWVSFLGIRKHYKKVYRPLLLLPKKKIIGYAYNLNIQWVDDMSNNCLDFRRNKIRKLLKDNYYSNKDIFRVFKKHENARKMITLFKNKYKKYLNNFTTKSSFSSISIDSRVLEHISNVEEFKLFINKTLDDYLQVTEIICTKSHWKNVFEILSNSKQGSEINLLDRIYILKDRDSFIIYINSDINKHFIVKFNSRLVNWYDSSFEISNQDSLNDSCKTIILPYEYLNKGLYITHWKYGDKITLKDKSKKISDLFINNKISKYDKKYYPIVRDSEENILWVPDIIKKNYKNCANPIYISWKR